MSENKSFNGFPLFDEVEDQKLRVHNTAVVLRNISQSFGDDKVKEYFKYVEKKDKVLVIHKLAEMAGRKI